MYMRLFWGYILLLMFLLTGCGGADDNNSNLSEDTLPPSITAPNDIVITQTDTFTSTHLGTPIINDAVDPTPVVNNDAPAEGFPIGTTTVTWTATDDSGNSASDTQLVTVNGVVSALCSYSISSTDTLETSSGGSGNVNVFSPAACVWSATSDVNWITIINGTSGLGNGVVTYSVLANNSTNTRRGTLTIAEQVFIVSQSAADSCSYSISPSSIDIASGTENGKVNISAPAGCSWNVQSNDSWITITSGASGSGSGEVSYTVDANPTSTSRNGSLTVAEKTLPVTQAGEVEHPIPGLTQWEQNMATHGARLCDAQQIEDYTLWEGSVWYYDGAWVYYQIADYAASSGLPTPINHSKKDWSQADWEQCARFVRDLIYRPYVLGNEFSQDLRESTWDGTCENESVSELFESNDGIDVSGWRVFPHGLYEDFLRSEKMAKLKKDPSLCELKSLRAARSLSQNAAFAKLSGYQDWGGVDLYLGHLPRMHREVSYAIRAEIVWEKSGQPRTQERLENGSEIDQLQQLTRWIALHWYQFQTGNYHSDERYSDFRYLSPFMFGLGAHAMIDFYEWQLAINRDPNEYWVDPTPDGRWPNMLAALSDMTHWLFHDAKVRSSNTTPAHYIDERLWVSDGAGGGAFRYADIHLSDSGFNTLEPAPDLNLLIAPAYAWLYKMTSDEEYRIMGDQIFLGGVTGAHLDTAGKQFSQNYRWSFDYVKWRSQ